MHHDDVGYTKKVLSNRDRTQSVDGATTGDYHRENGCSATNFLTCLVIDDLSRIDLAGKDFRQRERNLGRPRIIAVDDDCLERNCVPKRCPHGKFVISWALGI